MSEPYASPVRFVVERIHAAAVYCSDGRVGAAFDDFLTTGLDLPRYDRVAMPGGPACLAGHPEARLEEQGLLDELKFLVDAHALDRVILIQHAGCAFYSERIQIAPARMAGLQRADLVRAAHFVRKTTPLSRVEGWMANIIDDQITFEPVDVD